MNMKKCTKCHQVKSISEFYSNSRARDNHTSQCAECLRSACRELWSLPAYSSMRNAIVRCTVPTASGYHNYGGRGIRFDLPRNYAAFWKIVQPIYDKAVKQYGNEVSLEIERINTNGHYTEDNITFVPRLVNSNNRRKHHRLSFRGTTLTLAQWARVFGLNPSTILYRLKRGWTVDQALLITAG